MGTRVARSKDRPIRVEILVTPAEYLELSELARASEKPIATFVRDVIGVYVARHCHRIWGTRYAEINEEYAKEEADRAGGPVCPREVGE